MNYSIESNVRSYCRNFQDVFNKAEGSLIFGSKGKPYIDFLSACGSLNYGHNHPDLKEAFLSYVTDHGIIMSLNMETQSKNKFMVIFYENILNPRRLDYKFQFPSTNGVEAAIQLARKVTGRVIGLYGILKKYSPIFIDNSTRVL